MTRNEFLEYVNDFDSLGQFCYDNGLYDFFDDIISQDDLSETIMCDLRDCMADLRWEEIRDLLYDIPEWSYEGYYRVVGMLRFEELAYSDFLDLKDDVLQHADDEELFDDDGESPENHDHQGEAHAKSEDEWDADLQQPIATLFGLGA